MTTLTRNQVRLIRHWHAIGVRLRKEADELSHESLAARYGVTKSTVCKVVSRQLHKSVREVDDICDECGADFSEMSDWQRVTHACD